MADQFAFLLGVGYALKIGKEGLGGVDGLEPDVQVTLEGVDDLLGFALTQQAVIDEQAGQLVPDGLVQQGGHD